MSEAEKHHDAEGSSQPTPPSTTEVRATQSRWRQIWMIISYTPKSCRYDPSKPLKFSLPLNLLFGFAGTFTVANLYYNHPILNRLAEDFHVTFERASLVPTLAQAGYASGLLFLCPLGDIFRRRDFVLSLVLFTATVWIGLCLTRSFAAFCTLTYLTSVTTVTPQLMLPLVGELAPPHRRATALSIVVSALLLGILIARILSGVVTYYTSWRNIYWLACGLQYLIWILLWFFMPDYPSSNPSGINYFKMLWSILTIFFHEPVLVQASANGCLTSMVFTSYWTTLTFLLSSPPYNYSNLVIGLFALIGILGMSFGPPYSRFVIDKFVPLFSVIVGGLIVLTGIVIGTYTVPHTVAGPVVQAFLLDIGLQTSQIANRSNIYGIAPGAKNRVNTAYMLCVFVGQLVGTAAGNALYARGGWVSSGSASVGFVGAALLVALARGPWETGWIGWGGGWGLRRRDLGGKDGSGRGIAANEDEEKKSPEVEMAGKDQGGAVLVADHTKR